MSWASTTSGEKTTNNLTSQSESLLLTQHGLVAPQCWQLGTDEGSNRQVDEPHEEAGAEVEVESHLLRIVLQVERLTQLQQEPDHDRNSEGEDDVARPRLPLPDVRDDVYLHL